MKRLIIIAALLAAPAVAQLPGSGVIGAGGGTVGGVAGQVGVGGIGSVGAAGNVNGTIGAGQTVGTVNSSVRALDDSARDAAADAHGKLSSKAKVQTGARVERGTRCYAETDTTRAAPYDPVYRENAYYCAPTGPAVRAKVKAGG